MLMKPINSLIDITILILFLWSDMRFPHVFGGKLHEHLRKLPNFPSIKMCLVVFYTNEDKKPNRNGYEKDKAQCIEHFMLKHPNFCKIFNENNSNCSLSVNQQQPFKYIADKIIDAIKNLQSCP
jgi:hypothetical protein